jgi:hypothetical protein
MESGHDGSVWSGPNGQDRDSEDIPLKQVKVERVSSPATAPVTLFPTPVSKEAIAPTKATSPLGQDPVTALTLIPQPRQDAAVGPKIKSEFASLKTRSTRQRLHLPHLEMIISAQSTEFLEPAVKTVEKLLDRLKLSLYDSKDDREAPKWIQSIEQIQARAKRTSETIAVVGNTGAGKSSCTNAILDEEMVVPTSCMKACTAVITEIRWNDSEDPSMRYQAEIEYIDAESWERELNHLWGDLMNPDGQISQDHTNSETDAGVAYAKIKAVYPQLARTKEMIKECSPSALMTESQVARLLGTVKAIAYPEGGRFYQELRSYLESAENPSATKGIRQIAVWPLIKVVRIYLKSPVLELGTVIVDLVSHGFLGACLHFCPWDGWSTWRLFRHYKQNLG